MTNKRVSHYEMIRPLGSGGMGVVYEAQDTRLDRRVALKFLPAEMARDPQSLQRFQREARASSALNHANICTVYAIEQHDSEHFIVMELLDGETVAARLARQRFAIGELVDAAIQIADALESAHAKGIVHRDIKPANIFLNSRGQVKILDFGLAKFERAETATAGSSSLIETRASADLTSPGTALGTVALHVARAGLRTVHRRTHRFVFVRNDALSNGDRRAAISRRDIGRRIRRDSEPEPEAGLATRARAAVGFQQAARRAAREGSESPLSDRG